MRVPFALFTVLLLAPAHLVAQASACAAYEMVEAPDPISPPYLDRQVIFIHGYEKSEINDLTFDGRCETAMAADRLRDYWGVTAPEPTAMATLVQQLLATGHRVSFWKWPTLLSMTSAASELKAWIRDHGTAQEIILVGHSMGGLVALQALTTTLTEPQLRARTIRVVTLGTPHWGTESGDFFGRQLPATEEVQPDSPFISALRARRTAQDNAMTFMLGGRVPITHFCAARLIGGPIPGTGDCVVHANSAFDGDPRMPDATGDPHRIRLNGDAWDGYDHSQIALMYTADDLPSDASRGMALRQTLTDLLVSSLRPSIVVNRSTVQFDGTGEVTVAATSGNAGSLIGVTATVQNQAATQWLFAAAMTPRASATQPSQITVSANASGLAPGTYTGVVTISANRAPAVPVVVTLTVSPQSAPALSASPPQLIGGGTVTLSWTPVAGASSYTLERSRNRSFTDLAPVVTTGTSVNEPIAVSGTPVVLYYRVRANNSGFSNEVTVTAVPEPPTGMSVAPTSVSLTGLVGGGTVSAELTPRLDGISTFTWCVVGVVPAGTGNFLEFPSSCGNQSTLPIQVRANQARTAGVGSYSGTVEIRSPQSGNVPLSVPVTFEVRDGSSSGIDLVVENAYIDYAYHDPRVEGAAPGAQIRYYWNVKNIGTNTLAANSTTYGRTSVYWGTSPNAASICQNSVNLSGNVLNRTTAISAGGTKLEVEIDELPAAAYTVGQSYLMFHVDGDWDSGVCLGLPGNIGETNENNNHFILPLYIPRSAVLSGLAASATLTGGFGETVTASLPFTNSGDRSLVVQATSSDARIAVTVLNDRILLQTNTATWPPGSSSATLAVTSNGGNASVPVQLTVGARPVITLSHSAVQLTTRTPTQGELSISNGGGSTLSWNVASSAGWLSAIPAAGVNAGTVVWTADPAGLVPGTYTATLDVSAAYAENSPATLTVSLIVPPPPQARILITPGGGAGTVRIDPGAATCQFNDSTGSPAPCDAVFDPGAAITLTAAAASGFLFHHWRSGTDSVSASNPFSLSLAADRELSAEFRRIATLSVQADAGGIARQTGGGATGFAGRSVTVAAEANQGMYFRYWALGTDSVSIANPYTFSIDEDRALTAVFSPPARVTYRAEPAQGGTVSLIAGTVVGPIGRSVTVQVQTTGSYQLGGWHRNGAGVGAVNPLSLVVTGDVDLVAVVYVMQPDLRTFYEMRPAVAEIGYPTQLTVQFRNNGYTSAAGGWSWRLYLSSDSIADAGDRNLLTQIQPQTIALGGRIDVSASFTVPVGVDTGTYRLIAVADALGELVENDDANNAATYDVTVAGGLRTLQVAASPPDGGRVELLEGSLEGLSGRMARARAIPNDGFQFRIWRYETPSFTETWSAVNPLEFSITDNATLLAVFERVTTLTVSSSPPSGGTAVISSGLATGPLGRSVSMTATPAPNHIFRFWRHRGDSVSVENPYVRVVSADDTVTAVFGQSATLLVTAGAGGSAVQVSGTPTGLAGRSVRVLASAGAGFLFRYWSIGTDSVSADSSYAFSLPGDRTINAVFGAAFTLQLVATPTGSGTVQLLQGNLVGLAGRLVRVNAIPAADHVFVAWKEGSTVVSRTAEWSGIVSANRTLTAEFLMADVDFIRRALDHLRRGTGLSITDQQSLDLVGNQDGAFNLGDILALLDRPGVVSPTLRASLLIGVDP